MGNDRKKMGNDRKKRLGDRRDGRRLRTLDPYNAMTPFIMKVKSDSSNYFSELIEVSAIERFLRLKRQQGFSGIGMMHIFVAAYTRVISQFPGVNRFVSGQRIFARNNIEFLMTVKKEMKTTAGETSIKVTLCPGDTVEDIYNKLNAEIGKVKGGVTTTDTDEVAAAFMKLPRLVLKFAVFFLTKLDYFGLLPKSLLKASPFHGSFIITDLGSMGMPAIYHHLYDFGNMPVFISLGAKKKQNELMPDGGVEQRKYVDFKFVADERVCDGFYFSQAFKLFKSVLKDPEQLDVPPEAIVEDVD